MVTELKYYSNRSPWEDRIKILIHPHLNAVGNKILMMVCQSDVDRIKKIIKTALNGSTELKFISAFSYRSGTIKV